MIRANSRHEWLGKGDTHTPQLTQLTVILLSNIFHVLIEFSSARRWRSKWLLANYRVKSSSLVWTLNGINALPVRELIDKQMTAWNRKKENRNLFPESLTTSALARETNDWRRIKEKGIPISHFAEHKIILLIRFLLKRSSVCLSLLPAHGLRPGWEYLRLYLRYSLSAIITFEIGFASG